MRIALFHPTLPEPGRKPGGVEMTVHRLANALVQYEHMEVTMFSSYPKPQDALYDYQPFLPGKLRTPSARIFVAPVVLNFTDFSKFDVLHLHGDDWFYVHRQVPTVRTVSGSALYEARTATSWKRKVVQYMVHPLTHLAVGMSTVTLGGGTEATALYKLSRVMDYGVDISFFKPRPKSPTPLLFYIGTWGGRKRGELAYKAFIEHVLPKFPDARLYMATDNCPDHPSVINGGFPTHEELAKWLGEAWVFVYPSNYEGFGIPYIEAMASGTAIVSTRNSGAEYVLDHGKYGCISDDDKLGQNIVSLLEDRAQCEAMQAAGLDYVGKFSWPEVAARHTAVYREAIGKWKR